MSAFGLGASRYRDRAMHGMAVERGSVGGGFTRVVVRFRRAERESSEMKKRVKPAVRRYRRTIVFDILAMRRQFQAGTLSARDLQDFKRALGEKWSGPLLGKDADKPAPAGGDQWTP